MAIVRRTAAQIAADGGRVNLERLTAVTEAAVEAHMREEGYDPNAELRVRSSPATQARVALGLTQQQLADLTKIPVKTLQNWEQHRTQPDATARALLRILMRQPEAAKRALSEDAA